MPPTPRHAARSREAHRLPAGGAPGLSSGAGRLISVVRRRESTSSRKERMKENPSWFHAAATGSVLAFAMYILSTNTAWAGYSQSSAQASEDGCLTALLSWLPVGALIGFWFFFMWKMLPRQRRAMELAEKSQEHLAAVRAELVGIRTILESRLAAELTTREKEEPKNPSGTDA